MTIRARIDRVVEQEGQRHPVRATPFEVASVEAEVRPHPHEDSVVDQVA